MLACAVALALLSGSAGDRPGLGGTGVVQPATNVALAGASASAGARAGDQKAVSGTKIAAVSRRPGASSVFEHSSRVTEAAAEPASPSLFPLVADALAPPSGGRGGSSHGELRADSLTTFDDPVITVDIVGQGTWTLTGDTTGQDCSSSPQASGGTCDVNLGDAVVLTVSPSSGTPAAINWSGVSCDGQSGATCSFTAADSTDETDTVSLIDTITTATDGNGTVAVADGDQSGLGCSASPGAACLAGDGDPITLTAAAATGSTFESWSSGHCAGQGNPCQITATGNETDQANFTVDTYTISASAGSNGSVAITDTDNAGNCSGDTCSNVPYGDQIQISPSPTTGYSVGTWSGGGSCTGTANPCTFKATQNETDQANFTVDTYTISASAGSNGSVAITDTDNAGNCSGDTCSNVPYGDQIQISPSPTTGYSVGTWSGGGSCTGTANPCTFKATQNETDQANFTVDTYTISASAGSNGSVAITDTDNAGNCSGDTCSNVPYGDQIQISPSPTTGYSVGTWSGGGSCTGTANPCTFKATQNETDQANFTVDTYTISASAGSNGSVAITDTDNAGNCSGDTCSNVPYGDQIQISPSPTTGYSVGTWSGGGSCTGTANPCTFKATQNETDQANFTVDTYTISASAGSNGSVAITDTDNAGNCSGDTCSNVPYGDQIQISPSPTTGYSVGTWSGGGSCTGTANPCTFKATQNETDQANFTINGYSVDAATNPGSGEGSVSETSVSSGGSCADATDCTVEYGGSIVFTASAANGYHVSSWSGASCAEGQTTNTTCTINNVGTNTNVTVAFTINSYSVDAATNPPSGEGTVSALGVSAGGSCTDSTHCTVEYNGSIVFTASAANGYHVSSWSGAACAEGQTTDTTCTIDNVAANTNVTVAFSINTYSVDATTNPASGEGTVSEIGVSGGGSCTDATHCTVDYNASIEFTASAANGYHVSSWSGATCTQGQTTNTTCTIDSVGANTNVTVAFSINSYTVSATTNPASGEGTVTATDSDTNSSCGGASCTADYGDSVTLTAKAAGGFNFAGWSGPNCPTQTTNNPSPVCTVANVTAAASDTANFVVAYTVHASVGTGSGSVTAADATNPLDCTGGVCTPSAGDLMQLTANPATGWSFNSWSGLAPYGCQGLDASCTFGAADNETDSANFVIDTEEINGVSAGGGINGTVSVSDSNPASSCTPAAESIVGCTADYGDQVVLTATPDSNYHLIGWTGGTCAPATSDTCTVTADASETDTATFGPNSFTITATTSPSGEGRVTLYDNNPNANCNVGQSTSASCTVSYQDDIVIAAYPTNGNHFAAWAAGGSCTTFTGAKTCAFQATQAETDTADFAPGTEFLVSATSSAGGSATVADPRASFCSASGSYCDAGVDDTVTLTAFPNNGYSLLGWSGGTCTGITSPCVIDPNNNAPLSADETDNAAFALAVPGDGSPALPGNGNPVYVSPNGSDSNPGTKAQPVATPQRGLAIIEGSGGAYNQLRIAQGSYSGGLSLTSKDNGIGIYGGYDPTSWSRTLSPTTSTTISGSPAAVVANGVTGITLQELNLTGQSSSNPSSSTYGILAINGSSLTLNGVAVRAGNGTSGSTGTNGSHGAAGSSGSNGGSGEDAGAGRRGMSGVRGALRTGGPGRRWRRWRRWRRRRQRKQRVAGGHAGLQAAGQEARHPQGRSARLFRRRVRIQRRQRRLRRERRLSRAVEPDRQRTFGHQRRRRVQWRPGNPRGRGTDVIARRPRVDGGQRLGRQQWRHGRGRRRRRGRRRQ